MTGSGQVEATKVVGGVGFRMYVEMALTSLDNGLTWERRLGKEWNQGYNAQCFGVSN